MVIKKYVKHLFGIAFAIFISNKFFLRPWVIEHDLPELFQIVVFSIPNLIEAILGTLVLTGILLQLRQKVITQLISQELEKITQMQKLLICG